MSISASTSTSSTNLTPYQILLENRKKQKEQIKKNYGEHFTKIIGAKTIQGLKEIPAEALNLTGIGKYPVRVVTPSMLKNCSAARTTIFSKNNEGEFVYPRSAILIKVDLLDPNTLEKVDTVVEVIFKRYWNMNGNYVTALYNLSELNQSYPSTLYAAGGMTEDNIAAVAQLLEGETIATPYTTYLVRMAEN